MDLTAPAERATDRQPAQEPHAPPPALPNSRLDRAELLSIALGGAVGTLARAGLSEALQAPPGSWPLPTFLVNIAGALLLGWLMTRLQERLPITTLRRPLLGTGLCGGLTTFSTFQLEVVTLIEGGHIALAASYLTASISAGLIAVYAASALSRRVRRLR